ncbi:16499_t:CDS:2 [Cetraspora pellucida]|uniref:16499_t:CDS:1 n=1 Tax=Cetraspora pellucida TaxID=1433469 RepID=A0A9N9ENC4_9GLOM|nr:16499_t:CDS:2 [Cetraspora pellucida]
MKAEDEILIQLFEPGKFSVVIVNLRYLIFPEYFRTLNLTSPSTFDDIPFRYFRNKHSNDIIIYEDFVEKGSKLENIGDNWPTLFR